MGTFGRTMAQFNEATEAYLKKFEKLRLHEDTAMHAALEQDVARVHNECNEERERHQAAREKRAAARAAREAAKGGLFRDATNQERPSAQSSKDERIAAERAIVAEQAIVAERARQQAERARPPAEEAPREQAPQRMKSRDEESRGSACLFERRMPVTPVPPSHTSSWSGAQSKMSAGRRAMKAMGRSVEGWS